MRLGRTLQAAALLTVMVGSAAACDGGDTSAPAWPPAVESGGPLFVDNAHTTWLPAKSGDIFSDGFEILRVTGSQPAMLRSVEPIGGSDTMRFLGARVGMPGRPDDFNQNMPGYPPRAVPARYQQDLAGTMLEPGKTYMLILGFKVTDADQVGRRSGLLVSYESGGQAYQDTLPAALVTCPDDMTEKECEREAS